jgi:small-conductance mechanosensitive channel
VASSSAAASALKKVIAADQKDSMGLEIHILKYRLALQRSLRKSDAMRDMLKRLEADMRSGLKSGNSAAVTADKAAITSIKNAMTDLAKEQKDITTLLRSDIKKDVAARKTLVSTIAKDETAYKADLSKSVSTTSVSANTHVLAALDLQSGASRSVRAGARPVVHPVVHHPVDKK